MAATPLRDQIKAAFANNSYPGDDRLTVYDVGGRDYDETFQLLRGRLWHEMPVAEFIRGDTPIPDLTPEAFHYYMPALLLASIDDDNVDIAGSLAFFLSPSSACKTTGRYRYDDTEGYNHGISLFTEDQRAVVIRVLQEYVTRGWEDEEDVRETIDVLRQKTNDA